MFFHRMMKRRNEADHTIQIFAAVSGKVIPVTQVADPVFAEKVLGDGIAIHPTEDEILSPVSGKVISVAETYHAYGLQTEDGAEILVHIGIDTVDLKGKGFQNHVSINQKVRAGTPLCTVDLEFLEENHYVTDVITLVTDPHSYSSQKQYTGITAEAGKTCVIELTH